MSGQKSDDIEKNQPRVDWVTVVSSLPEPTIFIVSLALSLFFIFQSPESTWLGVLMLVEGLNGGPNLSDAVAVFIPACITAFGSLFFISSSASRNIKNRGVRDTVMNVGFIISLVIVVILVLLVTEFKDALATCSELTNSIEGNAFQCAPIPIVTAQYLNLLFISITGLTVLSMILSKFVIVVFRDR